MFRKSFPGILVGLLLGLVPVQAAPAADAACSENSIPAFDVTAVSRRPSYRVGQTAVVDLHVRDAFTGQPQSGINAGLLVEGRRDRAVFGYDKTDEEGHALARVRLLPRSVKPGWARATAAAWEPITTPAVCTGRHGYREYKRLFRIEL